MRNSSSVIVSPACGILAHSSLSAMVDVTEPSDNESVRLKLIELLQNDAIWKDFGQDADIIEIECQYNEN